MGNSSSGGLISLVSWKNSSKGSVISVETRGDPIVPMKIFQRINLRTREIRKRRKRRKRKMEIKRRKAPTKTRPPSEMRDGVINALHSTAILKRDSTGKNTAR